MRTLRGGLDLQFLDIAPDWPAGGSYHLQQSWVVEHALLQVNVTLMGRGSSKPGGRSSARRRCCIKSSGRSAHSILSATRTKYSGRSTTAESRQPNCPHRGCRSHGCKVLHRMSSDCG